MKDPQFPGYYQKNELSFYKIHNEQEFFSLYSCFLFTISLESSSAELLNSESLHLYYPELLSIVLPCPKPLPIPVSKTFNKTRRGSHNDAQKQNLLERGTVLLH